MEENKKYDYSKEDIIQALIQLGITRGDSIFVHSNIGFFGKLKDATTPEEYYKTFKEAIFEVIGRDGTLVVPTFTFSFCWGQVYDKEKTPGVNMGFFSEMVRKDPQSLRSDDANFSVAAIGKNAEFFTKDVSEHSYGPGSFWERFLKKNGKICNFNLNSGSSFIHYVEKMLGVPYRWDKPFWGTAIINGKKIRRVFYHFVRDLDKPEHFPDFSKFDKRAKELGLAKTVNLGKGQIVSISAKDTFELIKREIKRDPLFTTRGETS